MRFRSLNEAIALVNQTGYGLTSGLESLDDREQEIWTRGIRAGNLYINRPTTGAIVLRQPFGGMGKSAFGAGIKAGGPNYVAQLMDFQSRADNAIDFDVNAIADALLQSLADQLQNLAASPLLPQSDISRLLTNLASYDRAAREEFLCVHDHFRLLGQDNLRRYLAIAEIRIRALPVDAPWDILSRICAARAVGCRITVSYEDDASMPIVELIDRLTDDWAGQIEFVDESDEQLADALREGDTHRVRYGAPDRVPLIVREAAADVAQYIADARVSDEGRVELLWYIEEQSISANYHRYGNLGERGTEHRREPE
jgi:RHH-type proline utilization regulon transcriptional repressor/proline dehydrogenase/delta 1-pyrroline-5-carboxylate dehydrogenase